MFGALKQVHFLGGGAQGSQPVLVEVRTFIRAQRPISILEGK
jgi:hypothetical protein